MKKLHTKKIIVAMSMIISPLPEPTLRTGVTAMTSVAIALLQK